MSISHDEYEQMHEIEAEDVELAQEASSSESSSSGKSSSGSSHSCSSDTSRTSCLSSSDTEDYALAQNDEADYHGLDDMFDEANALAQAKAMNGQDVVPLVQAAQD